MQTSKTTHLKHLLRMQDALISVFAFLLSINIMWMMGRAEISDTINHFFLVPFIFAFSFMASSLDSPTLHGKRLLSVAFLAAQYAAIIVICMLAVAYFGKLTFVSRYVLALFGVLLVSGILTNRLFLRWWYFTGRREHPDNFLQVLVIGTGNRAQRLVQSYKDNADWGINIIGMLDPSPTSAASQSDQLHILGSTSEIRKILAEQVVDEVIICLPRSLLDDVGEVVDACAEEAICLKFMADLYDLEGGHFGLELIGSWPVLSMNPIARDENSIIIKRIVDLFVAIPLLIVLAPLFILTALAIKLDSRGSVFFTQPRIGLNKRKFSMVKFRSMYADAEDRLAEIEHLNEADGPIFKIKDDPRITRVGKIIRRTSIDELPQLFNVVFGHMSLVGPRPMSTRDVSQFNQGIQRKRFSVRPGLACLREISGRSALSFDQWLALDLKYIEERSLWLDLKILFKLLPAVIKGDGAS